MYMYMYMYMYIVHNTMPHASLEWTQINRSVSINPLSGDIIDFQGVSINLFLYILWLHPKPTPTQISPEAKPDKLKIITSATVTKLVTEGSKAGSGRLVVTREGLEAREVAAFGKMFLFRCIMVYFYPLF